MSEKNKRWPLFLILSVLIATLYNILPTPLYYSKGLEKPIGLFEAEAIAEGIEKRLLDLEKESVDWARSFCNLIQVKPLSLSLSPTNPGQIQVSCTKREEAERLRSLLPRAGALIPFAPAKLFLPPQDEASREVVIQRAIPCRLEKSWFRYMPGELHLDSAKVAEKIKEETERSLAAHWSPQHPDFKKEGILRCHFEPGRNALYVSLKGAERLGKIYAGLPECDLTQFFKWDIQSLISLLYAQGYQLAPAFAAPAGLAEEGDLLLVNADYLQPILAASREKFLSDGRYNLFLPLTNREERILTQNRIEGEIQKDLVQWTEDFRAAQVHLDPQARYTVPKPTRSAFWNNCLLSLKKYWRGDERKILRWGLDLSGGKSVQIELANANGEVVKDDGAIRQGIEELTKRVNRMGVSEVSIRQMGHQIVLDFPGSQKLAARDLIAASTMSFHLVNETFSLGNSSHAESVNRFLQDVWNEAILTNKKDLHGINAIAVRRLASEKRPDYLQRLWDAGLRLSPDGSDLPLSTIAPFRGEERNEWYGQNHPLIILFKESALEGSSLANIHAGYDPSKGNFLSFEVKSGEAKELLYSWASRYCKESIAGTDLALITKGRGWRMAALLNDQVISMPALEAPLKDGGMISGSFSPREIDHLAKDLEAGSLSFTPRILLEKNVHPELGKSDRMKGLFATFVALLLVVAAMLLYYRFAGFIASCAVFFNLLILWAILQNLEAVLTLGSIAGIILTVGMAVDANVLVFERMKEELSRTGDLRLAVTAGYRKAYGAIIDSNLTTLIAALILLNFHAGPIKSFALNLLIGIISSLFTALFMTKVFFMSWLKKKNPKLTMMNWMQGTKIPFLKWSKPAIAIAAALILVGNIGIFAKGRSLFGLDFTGGYALHLELESGNASDVKRALLSRGLHSTDLQAQQLQPASHVRLLLASTLELPGKPFHGMPAGESSQRIGWIVEALLKEGLTPTPTCLAELPSHWTAMSGQVSDTMRGQALIALALALLAIFVYLTVRFEFRYAVAALVCLFHDLFITLGSLGLLHLLGVSVQIDLTTIAALMTIIGYSLNDTIIIFDRVREDRMTSPHKNLATLVDASLNATLSRTTITSGTTLLVLVVLLLLGGSSLFNFSLTLSIGVLLGTLSSWFIASPLLILLNRERGSLPKVSVT